MKPAVFKMANALEEVEPMVLALKTAVEDKLTKEAVLRFEICVIEALTNHTEHAQPRQEKHPIEIVLRPRASGVTVDIFDPLGMPAFDLRDHALDLDAVDPMQEGGRGLGLILECADRVDYGARDGRNRLSLEFSDAF